MRIMFWRMRMRLREFVLDGIRGLGRGRLRGWWRRCWLARVAPNASGTLASNKPADQTRRSCCVILPPAAIVPQWLFSILSAGPSTHLFNGHTLQPSAQCLTLWGVCHGRRSVPVDAALSARGLSAAGDRALKPRQADHRSRSWSRRAEGISTWRDSANNDLQLRYVKLK